MCANVLLVFIKYPQAGLVKTRLAKTIGIHKAALLYRLFVEALLKRTEGARFQRVVFFTPAGKKIKINHWLGKDVILREQRGKGLGERLSSAFKFAFKNGAKRVVAIGSDNPLLDAKNIERAFEELKKASCVLGPAADGGYYLIGLSSFEERVFQGISWGTEKVFAQTMRKLRQSRKSYYTLPAFFDVDTYDDIILLKKKLQDAFRINSLGLEPIFDILSIIVEGQGIKNKRKG